MANGKAAVILRLGKVSGLSWMAAIPALMLSLVS
jgi:hypothetical protein